MQGDPIGEKGGEGQPPDDHHRAFHELTAAFTGSDRPKGGDDLRARLGDSYDYLPDHVRSALEGMTDDELAEIGKAADRLQDSGMSYELPGGRVCLL